MLTTYTISDVIPFCFIRRIKIYITLSDPSVILIKPHTITLFVLRHWRATINCSAETKEVKVVSWEKNLGGHEGSVKKMLSICYFRQQPELLKIVNSPWSVSV